MVRKSNGNSFIRMRNVQAFLINHCRKILIISTSQKTTLHKVFTWIAKAQRRK